LQPKSVCFAKVSGALILIAILLALTMAVTASGEEHAADADGAGTAADASRVRELPARRSATSNTFLLDNGALETQLFEVPVNYRDETGRWQPIEEDLEETSSGAITNGDNSFDVQLPSDLDKGAISLAVGDEWISEAPLGIGIEPVEVKEGVATYQATDGSATFEFAGLSNGLKGNIVLTDTSAPDTFYFRLDASQGVVPHLDGDGSVQFVAADGTVIAELPAPVMFDDAGVTAPPGTASYGVEDLGEAWKLTVTAAPAWVHADGRSWPVTIDPSKTVPAPALDCVISTVDLNPLCGVNGWGYLVAKANYPSGSADAFARSLLRFDLSSIPSTASLTSATIGLYSGKTATNVTKVDLYDVSREWISSKVTWIYSGEKENFGKWKAPGGDYGRYMPNPAFTTPAKRGGSQPGWWTFSSSQLTWLAQRWLDGIIKNNGVLLKLADETPRVCCIERQVEWESSAATNKPYLSVQYIEPATTDKKVTSPTDGTKTAKRFLLTSAWEQSGVEGVTFQYKSSSGWINVPANKVLDSKTGQSVNWPLTMNPTDRSSRPLYWDASGLAGSKSATKVQIRALFQSIGGESTYSKPVEGEVDRNSGGPKDASAPVGPGSVDLLTGNLTVSKTDFSIAGIGSSLEFSRSFSSREPNIEAAGVLGPGWRPAFPVEEAGGSAWTKVKIEELTENSEVESEEGETQVISETYKWAAVSHADGGEIPFEETNNQFVTPPELKGFVLARLSSTEIALTDPAGNRTIFSNEGSGNEYLPKTISQTGGANNKTKFTWEFVNGKRRLKRLIGPSQKERTCDDPAWIVEGCRVLEFSYQSATTWGAPESAGARLAKITYNSAAFMPQQEVAKFEYNSAGRLIAAWDPRLSSELKEAYTYTAGGQISTITPPGQEPWSMEYDVIPSDPGLGRLVAVKRATLVEGKTTGQTTIRYAVPLTTGAGGPYGMGAEAVAAWGQEDVPADATAIFSPDEVPQNPPSSYARATVYYLDAEGQVSNVATPLGAGTSAPSITTTETDRFGNVTRELSAQNRLRALAEGSGSVARSRQLDSQFRYSADGTELQEEEGPMHLVRLPETGTMNQARSYRAIEYDANFLYLNGTTTPSTGETKPHLPTSETNGALLTDQSIVDKRTTKYIYDWKLRKPKEVISNPETTEESRSVTLYDPDSGLPTEIRQPKEAATGGGAGTTRIVYWRTGFSNENCSRTWYAGLPCKIEPASQPGTAGQPALPIKEFLKYNPLGQPEEIRETTPGGGQRKITVKYDSAGRQLTREITGGGVAFPKTETEYSTTLGLPIAQRFKCESDCGNPEFRTSVGGSSQGQTPLKNPTDAVIASNGNIWVVDQGNNRVVVYNEAGEFVREMGGLGSTGGKLNKPSAITIDSVGTVDVTDTANNRVAQYYGSGVFIQVLGANVNKTKVEAGAPAAERNRCTAASGDVCQAGTAGTSDGQMSEPVGITTNGGQSFFVVERANNRVEKFSSQGEWLAKFGGPGPGDGQLKEPTAINLSGSLLWVADTGNNRMQAFTTSYVFSRKFGTEGPANGQLIKPTGVDTDSSGNVWVSDQGNSRVQKFSSSGAFLLKFGAGGTQEGQFGSLAGIGSDGKGNLFIADSGNNRVQKWSTNGFDTQETTTAYDSLGRATIYKDADGNEAKTTYDFLGRPITQSDGKGTQTLRYDSVTGLLVELEDSAAGLFTASYDADGQMVKQGLPNGLTREMTVDEAGEATGLTYTKASNCGTSCTWLSNTVQRSIRGQILLEEGTLGKDEYAYDKLGRLTTAWETLTGGSCTTRTYAYDKDSNRTGMTTIPAVAGACSSSGGTSRSYTYDGADRLIATGLTYDDFGRITSLPGEFVGGKTLTTSYFSNDMVSSQTQDGVTNSFQLDAMLRHRQRLQAGGLQGTEVFHYASSSDSPAWSERGSSWTRNIAGIGGDLAGIQESGKEIELQLINIHGDVSATAALSPAATSLKSTFTYDEFGNRTSGSSGRRFAWLGGKQRRTELASGVVQMGVRSYIPQLGRFLSPDPVFGGSANPYDYANQDPINVFDLDGNCAGRKNGTGPCAGQKHGHWKKWRARSNKNDAIVLKFKNKVGAERFLSYLRENPMLLRNLEEKTGAWREKEFAELQKLAREKARVPNPVSDAYCQDLGTAIGLAGMGSAIAGPATGGAGYIVGIGLGALSLATEAAGRTGLC
jgi:RHS repeat-associated protein